MKIQWNPTTIQWFRDASAYTGYSRKLTELLLPYIPHRGTLCDMGCGAAVVDFEFAKYFQDVTCVDISPKAIAEVAAQAQKQGVSNLHPVCIDGKEFRGNFDTVIALFHGGPNIYEDYYPLAKQQLIIITHLGKCNTFSSKKHQEDHHFSSNRTKVLLDELKIRYTYLEESIEYGQPFRCLEDAITFMEIYKAPGMTQEELMDNLEKRLVKTEDPVFPYYLPNQKRMAIFIINKYENPEK